MKPASQVTVILPPCSASPGLKEYGYAVLYASKYTAGKSEGLVPFSVKLPQVAGRQSTADE
jgi:hypothetical protein